VIHKITAKQQNSKMCLICGLQNEYGLKAVFYETDRNELIALFTPKQQHQGYPGRLHGGIAAAILDEAIGRNINIGKKEQIWGVTLEFNIKFRKPIPLDKELKAVTHLTSENKRIFEGTGEILLPDGTVGAVAKGRYLKMAVENISSDFTLEPDDWVVVESEEDPETIDL
jgi:uncharacterized protein (TIGR00369 family)